MTNPLYPHGQDPATGEGLPDPNSLANHKLVLIHFVGPDRHECFLYAGTMLIGDENHLNHDGDPGLAEPIWPVCLATLGADIAIGLDIELDERRVDETEFAKHAQGWSLLDFSATTEWANRGGYGTPPAARPD